MTLSTVGPLIDSIKGKGKTCRIRFRKDLPWGSWRPPEHEGHRTKVKKNKFADNFFIMISIYSEEHTKDEDPSNGRKIE